MIDKLRIWLQEEFPILKAKSQIQTEPSPQIPPTPEVAKARFRTALTEYVSEGWKIEIENEFDAVISRKPDFYWGAKLIIFIILLLIWFPLAIFYLIVILIRGITANTKNRRLYIDEDGQICLE